MEPTRQTTQNSFFSPPPARLADDTLPAEGQQPELQASQLDARNPAAAESQPVMASYDYDPATARRSIWRRLRWISAGLLLVFIAAGGVIILAQHSDPTATVAVGSFNTVEIPLDQLDSAATASVQTLAINGRLIANGSLIVAPSSQPASPVAGQLYFDQTTSQLAFYNGSAFVNLLGGGSNTVIQNTTINGTSNAVTSTGGTSGRIPKFTGTRSVGNSIMTDDGTQVTIEGNLNVLPTGIITDEFSLWPDNPTPGVPSFLGDNESQELGVRFRSSVDGYVKGIRFYKGATNTGTHTGNLWSTGGGLLATATFGSETASGWQEVRFPKPVPIAANTIYTASYHAPVGNYAADPGYFANKVLSGPLEAMASSDGGNGMFRSGSGPNVFPNQTFTAHNYWVDLVFTPRHNSGRLLINNVPLSTLELSDIAEIAKLGNSQTFGGINTFRNGTDSTSAFTIQNGVGVNLFVADTINNRIFIGPSGGETSGIVLVLANKTTVDDPVGIEGGMYYNRAQKMFRCYRNDAWDACANLEVDRGFELYDEFMGGQTTSLTANDNIGSLGWHAEAIGANGSLSFNPATPTPVADRPGVLRLTTPAVANQGTTLMLSNASAGSMLIAKDNILKTTVAVGSVADQVLRVGLHTQSSATTQPVSGIWWEADPAANANWRYCFGNGTTATCAPSTTAIAANTWVRLTIQIVSTGSGTSRAILNINGNPNPYVASNVTIDTTNQVSPAYSCYATTGATKDCYLDYFQLKGTANAVR
jgi:Domain of unknown function (DUF4082)